MMRFPILWENKIDGNQTTNQIVWVSPPQAVEVMFEDLTLYNLKDHKNMDALSHKLWRPGIQLVQGHRGCWL